MKKDKKEKKEKKQLLLAQPVQYEPSRANQFIINFIGIDIPVFLFTKYEIYNEGEELIFTTEMYEILNYILNPEDFFNITDVRIDFLDPTGVVVNFLKFGIKKSNFEKKGEYGVDDISRIEFVFTVDRKTIETKKNLVVNE